MNDFSKSSLVRSEQNLQNYQLTEIGYIPKDWNVLKLESLVTYRNGVAHEDCIETSGEYVVVNSKFISTDGDVKKYSSQCRLSAFSREILMVMSDVPNGKAIAKCYFVKDNELLTINQRICALKSINSDSKYLFYVLNRNAFYLAFDDGAKQTNLRRQDVLDCPIAIPSRQEEQTAIANALSDVDALIQELEKLIAKKQAIKTATMQQLLTGRTRLPQFAHHPDGRKKGYKPSELGEIPEDWEVYPLGNLVKSTQLGGNYKNTEQDSVHPLIKMGNLGRGHIKLDKLEFIVGIAKQIDRLNYGDLLFNTRNTLELVGKVSVWRNELPEAYFNSNLMRICFKNELVGSNFYMNAVMNSESFVNDLSDIATGTTSVAAIYSRDLLQLRIALPQPDEQICIAEVLINMDDEIQLLEQRLNKTRQIKQGMMQELLTGKTRLVKPAEPA